MIKKDQDNILFELGLSSEKINSKMVNLDNESNNLDKKMDKCDNESDVLNKNEYFWILEKHLEYKDKQRKRLQKTLNQQQGLILQTNKKLKLLNIKWKKMEKKK